MNSVYITTAALLLPLASLVQATEPSLAEINDEIALGLGDRYDAQAQLQEDEDSILTVELEIERLAGEIAVKEGRNTNLTPPTVAVGFNKEGYLKPVQIPILSTLLLVMVSLSPETRKELKELEVDLKLATDAYGRLIEVYEDDLKRLSFVEAELEDHQELKAELEALEAKEAR